MIFCILAWTSFLSSCLSLQDGQKVFIYDVHGITGIHSGWKTSETHPCPYEGWNIISSLINTCTFTKKSCTVVSPQYIVNQANELFIDITTETRHFTTCPKSCDSTFVLFVAYQLYQSRRVEVIGNIPQFIPSHTNSSFFKRREIINFSKDQEYDYIMVGLNASRYCGSVSSFSMYYYNCPASTNELIEFVQEAAPNISSSPMEVLGKCIKNAVQKGSSPLVMKCFFNGSFEIWGNCECRPGFTNVTRKCKGWY